MFAFVCAHEFLVISSTLKVHIRHSTIANTLEHRLVWCPMVEEDDMLVLAVSHGEMVCELVHALSHCVSG